MDHTGVIIHPRERDIYPEKQHQVLKTLIAPSATELLVFE